MKDINYEKAVAKFLIFLEEKGLRKTTERMMMLEEIYSRHDHFDAEDLYRTMVDKKQYVSRATIYNNLEVLLECGLIRKNQFGNNVTKYEKAANFRQHDHLICLDCQQVKEFCDPRLQQIQKMIGEMMKFEITQHDLLLYGHCEKLDCENKKILNN